MATPQVAVPEYCMYKLNTLLGIDPNAGWLGKIKGFLPFKEKVSLISKLFRTVNAKVRLNGSNYSPFLSTYVGTFTFLPEPVMWGVDRVMGVYNPFIALAVESVAKTAIETGRRRLCVIVLAQSDPFNGNCVISCSSGLFEIGEVIDSARVGIIQQLLSGETIVCPFWQPGVDATLKGVKIDYEEYTLQTSAIV